MAGISWSGSSPSWEDMWQAIKAVWASKWNSRAVSSLRKAGLRHQDLQMAVLCQPLISPQYAFVAHTTNPITGLLVLTASIGAVVPNVNCCILLVEDCIGGQRVRKLKFMCLATLQAYEGTLMCDAHL